MPDSEPGETDAIALSVVVNPEAPTDLHTALAKKVTRYWDTEIVR